MPSTNRAHYGDFARALTFTLARELLADLLILEMRRQGHLSAFGDIRIVKEHKKPSS